MAQWPIYLTIGNLSHEIRRSRVKPEGIMDGFIAIHKRDLFDVKMEIYHRTMGVITKDKCNNRHSSDKFPSLHFENWQDIIALKSVVGKGLLIMCADRNVWQCHPIIAGMSVDYKEQLVITGIKSGMQYSICQEPHKKRENLYKMWPKKLMTARVHNLRFKIRLNRLRKMA